jgi:flagellar secretion chaperone FliS
MTSIDRSYRQQAGEFATPAQIVGQAYDQIIRALHLAARAVERRDIEFKTNELNRVLAIIGHLQSALDFERGPEVAARLDLFYRTMRQEIMRASVKLSATDLRIVAGYFNTLRDAWSVVEATAIAE